MTKEEKISQIKGLISNEVCMGTFGLVELELRELVKIVESQLQQNKVEERECEHKNELMYQGDGFVYVKCKDCGIEL